MKTLTLEQAQKMMAANNSKLYLAYTSIESLPEGMTVGGSLWLRGSKIKSLPEGLKVRGHLDLGNTPIEVLPEGLTVGGDLYLRGSNIETLPDGITVCGNICADFDCDETKVHRPKNGEVFQKDGHTFIFADRTLTVVKSIHKVGGYTFYKGDLPWNSVITDGEEFAHCKSIRDGIADLAFKKAKNRGQSQYKDVSLDDEFTVPELVVMYRIITGACKAGSEAFVSSLGELKERYSVREAIEITEGQYNAGAFAQFFGQ